MKPSFIGFGDCLPRVTAAPTMMPAPNRKSGMPAATLGVNNALLFQASAGISMALVGSVPNIGRANTHTMEATVSVVEVATAPVMQHSVAPIMSPINAPHMGILSGSTVSGPTNICRLQLQQHAQSWSANSLSVETHAAER